MDKTVLKKIIADIVKPPFKKANFKTSGTTFLKEENDFVKVFSVQSSVYNSATESSFTFNVGFFFPHSHRLLTAFPYPKSIKEKDCQIRIRGGYITHGKDYWYKINNIAATDNLKIEIRENVGSIIHFFEKGKSIKDLLYLKYLENITAKRIELDIAVALLENGAKEDATTFYNSYYNSYRGSGSWIKKLEQIASEKGIKLKVLQ